MKYIMALYSASSSLGGIMMPFTPSMMIVFDVAKEYYFRLRFYIIVPGIQV